MRKFEESSMWTSYAFSRKEFVDLLQLDRDDIIQITYHTLANEVIVTMSSQRTRIDVTDDVPEVHHEIPADSNAEQTPEPPEA